MDKTGYTNEATGNQIYPRVNHDSQAHPSEYAVLPGYSAQPMDNQGVYPQAASAPQYYSPCVPSPSTNLPPPPGSTTVMLTNTFRGLIPRGPLPAINSKAYWDTDICGCFEDMESCM